MIQTPLMPCGPLDLGAFYKGTANPLSMALVVIRARNKKLRQAVGLSHSVNEV